MIYPSCSSSNGGREIGYTEMSRLRLVDDDRFVKLMHRRIICIVIFDFVLLVSEDHLGDGGVIGGT